jgi:signal transduction histidine kinase
MSPITALLCSLSLIDESHPNANIILDSKHNTEKIMQFMRDQIDGNDSETLFSLSETVLMILRIMQHKAAKNSVTIKHISHGTKNFVFTKRTIISRILMNLISNSIDAFDTCKSENKNVYVETYTTNASIIISIRDNGCGMSNKQQKSIFKYFYTSKETGIGLGLPTVKRMVCYNLKGKIDCVSEINTGTTFTVTIPLS